MMFSRNLVSRNLVFKVLAIFSLTSTVAAQSTPVLFTDLRLRRSSDAAGIYSFRHAGDGVLKSYNAAGSQTASWNAETGVFSGTFSGTVAASQITAGTLSSSVVVQDASLSSNIAKLSSATNTFAGSIGAKTLNVTSAESNDHVISFGSLGGNTITLNDAFASYFTMSAGLNVSGAVSATSFSGTGSSLTSLNASALASGTVPDARFPATLPAASGANLTSLNATQLTAGTVPVARIPTAIPALSIGGGLIDNTEFSYLNNVTSNLQTQLNAKAPIASPTFTGTASGTFSGSGAALTSLNATNISAGTLNAARLPTTAAKYTDASPAFQGYYFAISSNNMDFGAVGALTIGGNNGDYAFPGQMQYDNDSNTFSFSQPDNQGLSNLEAGSANFSATVTASSYNGSGTSLSGIGKLASSQTWTSTNAYNGQSEFYGTMYEAGRVKRTFDSLLSSGHGSSTNPYTVGVSHPPVIGLHAGLGGTLDVTLYTESEGALYDMIYFMIQSGGTVNFKSAQQGITYNGTNYVSPTVLPLTVTAGQMLIAYNYGGWQFYLLNKA